MDPGTLRIARRRALSIVCCAGQTAGETREEKAERVHRVAVPWTFVPTQKASQVFWTMKFLYSVWLAVASFEAARALTTTSKFQVQIPKSLTKADGYDHRDALFGLPPYGGSIQQQVYYVGGTLCDPNVNPTSGYPQRPDNGPWRPPYILMVDRGDCTFVKKVRNAQKAGAAAVLIADDMCLCSHENCQDESDEANICEDTEPIMADDGSGADITIPSFLLFKEDADPIKQVLMANQQVRVSMSFSVPAPDSRVEYDMWTTPSDPLSRSILMSFKEAAVALGDEAFFTPHQYIYDGKQAGCVGADGQNQCFSLCTNSGRYCSTDPDDNLDKGISGADVVKESLRRICIWKQYGTDGVGKEWWDYIDEFMFRCGDPQKPDFFTNADCISDAMKHANINEDDIELCMSESGGLEGDNPNTILDDVLDAEIKTGVVLIPSFFVNQAPVRGAPSFSTIFRALCSGYVAGSEPDVCVLCATCHDEQGCVEQGECTAGGGGTLGNGSVSLPIFAGTLGVMLIIFGILVYVQHQRQQRYMRDHVRGIMAEYMPVSEQNRNASTSLAIPDTDHQFSAPDGPDDDDENGAKSFTIS